MLRRKSVISQIRGLQLPFRATASCGKKSLRAALTRKGPLGAEKIRPIMSVILAIFQ